MTWAGIIPSHDFPALAVPPLGTYYPRQASRRPQEGLGAAVHGPVHRVRGAARPQEHLDLVGRARAQAGDQAVEDEDEGHDRDDVDEEEDLRGPPVE